MSDDDREWMAQALALGALGEPAASPNPRVGCLVVLDGRVVGRGYHRAAGLPHAEAIALDRAGPRARGATLYVNLEPCAHVGRTPPCTEAILRAGIGRVVAALQDPNPLVDGRGFARLRDAGVRVEVGARAADSEELNAPFLLFHRRGRPLVTLKGAISADGLLAAAGGESRWITAEPARRFAQRLRLGHDAVLVGAGTLRRDDPRLTVRLPGVAAERLRVVLTPTLEVDPRARLFTDGGRRPRLYAAADVAEQRVARLGQCAEVRRVPARDGRLDLAAVLADLARDEIQALLVEGGARTFAGFLAAGLADRAALFVASSLLGARGATPLIDAPVAAGPDRGWRLVQRRQLALGADLLWTGRLAASG